MTGDSHLNRRLLITLFLVLSTSSTIFSLIVFSAYQVQLRSERANASREVTNVLRSSLENAMLKRDLQGLQDIVNNITTQDAIDQVSIVNREGKIRVSSDPTLLDKIFPVPLEELCTGCSGDFTNAQESITTIYIKKDRDILRSVKPVFNRHECFECHGSIEDHRVNGILIVDYDSSSIHSKAMTGMMGLFIAGIFVIILTITAVWVYMRRYILRPISALNQISKQFSSGDLTARSLDTGTDELSHLAKTFNTMAANIDTQMKTIQKSEEYLQTLIDANPDGIRVIDEDYNIIKFNTAYNNMLGNKIAERTSCYASSHNRSTPCIPTMTSCPLHEIQKTGEAIKTVQTFHGVNGKTFKTQVYSAPLETDSGQTMIVQSIRDMRHDVKYSHEQRLAALGQLAAGVGHEILNPLTSIRLALRSTLTTLREEDSECKESPIEYLELVDGEIDRCIDVTNRLRKLAILPDDHLQVVTINTSIIETVSLLKFEGEQQNVSITLELSEHEPRVVASESNIRTVILNLVQNAFHALPDGGTLNISSYLDKAKQQVSISFSDNGLGISESDLPYIFDPFYSSRADRKQGMGLGLSICLSIIDQHKGTIAVKRLGTAPNFHGTQFTVTMPEAI